MVAVRLLLDNRVITASVAAREAFAGNVILWRGRLVRVVAVEAGWAMSC